jgi:hypothetical protein
LKWGEGSWSDPAFFPIGVWLQSPANAERFKKAGINTYIALWKGPTEEQMETLRRAGMRLVCSQNKFVLQHLDDPLILGWMHGDEPDNAQELPDKKGYGPPVAPEKIVADYQRIKKEDPSRPVILNLGQGVAWDAWYGRGVRSKHPEDYPKYVEGCDIASFDIYPAVHDHPDVAGKLWYVAEGVKRLREWAGPRRSTWDCLECTRIGNPDRKPTPAEVRAEAWMSLIHGSQGLIYFVHQFKPTFREAALLDDPEMLAAVTALNAQITGLARVINSPERPDIVCHSEPVSAPVPVAVTTRKQAGATYVFAVCMRDASTKATFQLKHWSGTKPVEVLDEGRTLAGGNGSFQDDFGPWEVHLYRLDSE